MANAVAALVDWLSVAEQAGLRRAFAVWIKRVLLPGRMPGVNVPEVGDVLEIKTMLAEPVIEWTEQWKQHGLEQGLEQGLARGKREGEAAILERLLAKRFGQIPDVVRARLTGATADQLELWTEHIFDAPNLAAVFDSH